jgi:hypothetical protein
MALTMRPTGVGHGVYKDGIDYGIFSGDWLIGRIYRRKGFPNDVRFFLVVARHCAAEAARLSYRWTHALP